MRRMFRKALAVGLTVIAITMGSAGVGQSQGVICYFHGGGMLWNNKPIALTQACSPKVSVAITSDTAQGVIVSLTCVKLEPYAGEIGSGSRLVRGTTLYARGKVSGTANRYVLIQARDVGVVTSSFTARDSAAVRFVTGLPTGPRCGAGGLTLRPLKAGGFAAQGIIVN